MMRGAGTSGVNEEQVMHAMGIDDAYRVERVLAHGRGGQTELVTIDGSGPFVRKKMPLESANREVWAALAGSTCARLPRVAATYELPDQFAVVYDYVPGRTLEQVMASLATRGSERMAADEAVALLLDLCEAVSALHGLGIVHRDISPANVIVAADGAHLIDLGIAVMKSPGDVDADADVKPLGTWGFASPEQYGFARADERSDVYSLGRLLGYLVCGVEPAEKGYGHALADESVVPQRLRAVVERATGFEPSARYQSAAALAKALEAAVGEEDAPELAPAPAVSSEAHTVETAGSTSHSVRVARSHSKRTIAIVAAAAVVVIVAVAIVATTSLHSKGDGSADTWGGGTSSASSTPAGASDAGDSPDFLSDADGSAGSVSASDIDRAADALKLAETGWSVSNGYVMYGLTLSNTSDDLRIDFPSITITGYDESGAILFANTQALMSIMPGETQHYGGQAGNGTAPARVEFSVERPSDYNLRKTSKTSDDYDAYRVSELNEVSDGLGGRVFAGKVELESKGSEGTRDLTSALAVTVILRDKEGAIVYGETAFTTSRPVEGSPVMFETLCGDLPDYATSEAYAMDW